MMAWTRMTFVAPMARWVLRGALVWVLCFSALPHVKADAENAHALRGEELSNLLREIQAMRDTPEEQAPDFVVRYATPERMERFFRTPDLARSFPFAIQNGLIFAGRSTKVLTFERPSDVVAKVSSWFGLTDDRRRLSDRELRVPGAFGPYENWELEPSAFVSLWKCMPSVAWSTATRNLFARRLNDGSPLRQVEPARLSRDDYDFGSCVRGHNTFRQGWTRPENLAHVETVLRQGEGVKSMLRDKFARMLAKDRCQGIGPDDCVFVMYLWSSLDSSDAQLANAVRELEGDVAPNQPLPELAQPVDPRGSPLHYSEERFDQSLRRAAFLRAKLTSVLNAPSSWPGDALATTLRQMTRLRQATAESAVSRWDFYTLNSWNEHVSPWVPLASVPDRASVVQSAVLAELDRIDPGAPCEVFKQWFDHGSPSLQTAHVLRRLASGVPARCASVDWDWLQREDDPQARELRSGVVGLLGQLPGSLQDGLLTGLTQGGERCFTGSKVAPPAWLRRICADWISEPQQVGYRLRHSHLALGRENRYSRVRLKPIPPGVLERREGAMRDQERWLGQAFDHTAAPQHDALRDVAAQFTRRGLWVAAARQWRRRGSETVLIELDLEGTGARINPDPPFDSSRVLLLSGPRGVSLVGTPGRFFHANDDGKIVAVSDLDRDGDLEIWFSGTVGECDDESARPGIDCASTTIYMGEIRGDAVSYFTDSRRP